MRKQLALALLAALLLLDATEAQSQTGGGMLVVRQGTCDASAAVAVDADHFLVASDEDNILRMYGRNKGEKPLKEFDLNEFLDTSDKEVDIEGATRVGDMVYWIASHGRNKKAKESPTRLRFWANRLKIDGREVTLEIVGKPYQDLLKDMLRDSRLEKYRLADAAELAPKAGGVNIEGLAATPEGQLLIGFRSPISYEQALVVTLENPQEVVEGGSARFGDPIELDLGGGGIRGIEYWAEREQYVILAGPVDSETPFRLYLWKGTREAKPQPSKRVNFGDLHPESVIIYPDDKKRVQIVSDDGMADVGGQDCKTLDAAERRFRTAWFTP